MSNPVARLGDGSSHGGTIVTASTVPTEGAMTAVVGSMHACPLPNHGTTPITTGSPNFAIGGQPVARTGSVCGCGAVIQGGATKTVCA